MAVPVSRSEHCAPWVPQSLHSELEVVLSRQRTKEPPTFMLHPRHPQEY
jgi:hypothetical protein